ncbi:MAG TPA: MFS transporter [Methylomirabilota bacterium]|jgi:MFS family permease|nr:MFS transporter [Methylomirabilota bacterium]
MAPARLAVSTLFFVNGAVLASWLPHIPAIKARLTSGEAELGLVLLAMAAGAVVALPTAGWLVGLAGSRVTSATAAIALCLAMPLPVLSPRLPMLVASLAVLGVCNGLLDVSMNAQAVSVQQRAGRPIMSSFHALFSLGGVAGAVAASGAMAHGVDETAHVLGAAAIGLAAVLMALPALMPPEHTAAGPAFAAPSRALLAVGLLALLGLLAEGAMGDWSAVYLRDTLGASPATAAVGFAAFSLAMAAGRLSGDTLVARVGSRRLLRFSGGIAAVGLAAALGLAMPVAGVVGFALVGIGIANVIPVLFSAAARIPGVDAGRGLSAAATIGYLGFLSGPPLIGVVAEAAGLGLALGLVALACAVVAGGAGAVPEP